MSLGVINRFKNVSITYKIYQQVLKYSTRPIHKKLDQFNLLKEKLLGCNNKFDSNYITTIKHEVIQAGDRINLENFDSLFLESCIQNRYFDIGKQYFHHLYRSNDQISLALVRKYFRLCYYIRDCNDDEKQFIIDLYSTIMKNHQFLDDVSCECLSMGLSITGFWKEITRLINMSKEYGKPTNQLYSSIIQASFNNKEELLGWEYLEELLQNDMKPHASVYSAIINQRSDSTLLNLFNLMEKFNLYLPSEIVSLLQECTNSKLTNISTKGYCGICQEKLLDISINEKEFEVLTHEFLNPVLIGRDIFIKSKPTELKEFIIFLKKSPKIDVVIDGLNVAYSGTKKKFSPFNSSKMLLDVVMHFVRNDKRVMVLGRSHMDNWTLKHMKAIRNNSYVFLTDDLSFDDPYLLYATMYYGLGTKFVSRDLMRGHKYLLKTPEMKKIFAKWQQKHQLLLKYAHSNGDIELRDVGSYLMSPQCSGTRWHIPVQEAHESGVHPHLEALKMKWLCLDVKSKLFL